MDTLGEDLVLLSVQPGKAMLATGARIGYGLMGSELVRLAASGRIEIRSDRIVVVDQAPVGDDQLDAALHSLVRARRPPLASSWVGFPRRRIQRAYLERLAGSGVVRAEPGRLFGRRWFVADQARLARARANLDAIAFSTGRVSAAQAALGGLAGAVGLDRVLYPGTAGRAARRRLGEVGTGKWTVGAVIGAVADAADSASRAAVDASAQAATDAAVHAAVHAATQAAVHASSGGHGGGGHGGHH